MKVKNPNFNYEKYGKYYNEDGTAKKETIEELIKLISEYMRHDNRGTKKSSSQIRCKSNKTDRTKAKQENR